MNICLISSVYWKAKVYWTVHVYRIAKCILNCKFKLSCKCILNCKLVLNSESVLNRWEATIKFFYVIATNTWRCTQSFATNRLFKIRESSKGHVSINKSRGTKNFVIELLVTHSFTRLLYLHSKNNVTAKEHYRKICSNY